MAPPAIDINCMTLFELSLHPTSGISFAFALDVDALPSISVAGKPAQNFAAGAADSCVLQGRHRCCALGSCWPIRQAVQQACPWQGQHSICPAITHLSSLQLAASAPAGSHLVFTTCSPMQGTTIQTCLAESGLGCPAATAEVVYTSRDCALLMSS